MTTQEAIERLKEFCKLRAFCELYPDACQKDKCEIYMAIKALSCSEKPNRSDLVKESGDLVNDCISRQALYEILDEYDEGKIYWGEAEDRIGNLPSAQPEGWVKIPDTGIDDLSDGFHTFRQLYYQRMMLFATIVKQNKEKAWKSFRHEDGELCFGGGWFIVGIDTPEGSYTYHYEDNFYSMFDCEELERARHWDGHTENDVTRLLSLPSAQPEVLACGSGELSAQPEIIRCKDCWHYPSEYADCPMIGWARNENDFCSKAERRTDEIN